MRHKTKRRKGNGSWNTTYKPPVVEDRGGRNEEARFTVPHVVFKALDDANDLRTLRCINIVLHWKVYFIFNSN